jgi:RNA polymerase sigma-70 factor (ECF subfamily)
VPPWDCAFRHGLSGAAAISIDGVGRRKYCTAPEANGPDAAGPAAEQAELVQARVASPSAATPTPAIERPTVQALYREHFSFVWRTLRRLGVAQSGLDDAAQDVFLVVHRRLLDFEPGASPKPWLFGIALRVAQQHRRRQWRQQQRVGFAEDVFDVAEFDPCHAAMNAESADTVQRFLAALDVDKRNVFILADLEQMSGQAVAQALNVNLNTVYARLRAARKQLISAVQRVRARDRRREHG